MASVAKSFSAVGVGEYLSVRAGQKFTFSVSGTFSAGWQLERTANNGLSFDIIAQGSSAVSARPIDVGGKSSANFAYRMRCTSYVSGTMVTSLDTAAEAPSQSASGALSVSGGQLTRFCNFKPATLTAGTSTTPSATTLYLSQIIIPHSCVLTGIAVNNGATVGTDKYIVALFDSAGIPLANSAVAGVTTSGGDAFQSIAFTSPLNFVGPAVAWIGLYVNGTTDRFRSIPALGAYAGLAGSVTGQTFGTVAQAAMPTTFTADKGPVAFVY